MVILQGLFILLKKESNKMYNGNKVKLRAYCKDDIKLAQEYLNQFEIKKNLTPGIPYPLTLESEEKWYESMADSKDSYSFAIEDLKTGLYIGGCGINNIDWKNSVVTIGIFIGNKDYLSKGYGTDAMKVLVKFIFDEMNINKIKLNVYSFNARAIRCYEKCGFKKEGILRQEIFREGKYYDEIVMGILRKEYENLQESLDKQSL